MVGGWEFVEDTLSNIKCSIEDCFEHFEDYLGTSHAFGGSVIDVVAHIVFHEVRLEKESVLQYLLTP